MWVCRLKKNGVGRLGEVEELLAGERKEPHVHQPAAVSSNIETRTGA